MVFVGVPLVVVLEGPFLWVVVTTLLIGCAYGVLRRRLAVLAPIVFEKVPEPVTEYVPDRYRL